MNAQTPIPSEADVKRQMAENFARVMRRGHLKMFVDERCFPARFSNLEAAK